MAFDVRCRTPYGPFSNPELLDLKAPAAVHTAQGRIAEWNKEHSLNVADQPHLRQSTRAKAGAAQYEVLTQLCMFNYNCSTLLCHGARVAAVL